MENRHSGSHETTKLVAIDSILVRLLLTRSLRRYLVNSNFFPTLKTEYLKILKTMLISFKKKCHFYFRGQGIRISLSLDLGLLNFFSSLNRNIDPLACLIDT